MEDKKECWVNGLYCGHGESCEDCIVFVNTFSKLVFCNNDRCHWNRALPFAKLVSRSKMWKALGDDSGYAGICCRSELGVSAKDMKLGNDWVCHLAECRCISDRRPSGHMDFSRFPQKVDIVEPVDPLGAYH